MNDEAVLPFYRYHIPVYAHDVSAGEKHPLARAVLEALWQTGNGCLSVQVLQEFFVTVTLKVSKPLKIERARQLVAALATWRVHGPHAEDVLGAIDLQQRYRISFLDAMILFSASQLGAEVVLSEELSAGQTYDGLQVVNPLAIGS